MKQRIHQLSEGLFVMSCLIVAMALIVFGSQAGRQSGQRDRDERQVIRVSPELRQVVGVGAAGPGPAGIDDIRRSEEIVKQATRDMEAVKAEIDKKKNKLRKLAADSEVAAERQKQELQKALRDLSLEREKLEAVAKSSSDKARVASEEMAKAEASLEKQRALAAEQGIAQSFGRGRKTEMQTRFDPRTKRDPQMLRMMPEGPQAGIAQPSPGQITSLPAGVGEFSDGRREINREVARSLQLDNRLKATETFFELRRINRAARALESPPPDFAQVVRMASLGAPRRLNELELDPLTGDIAWPLALCDDMYEPEKTTVQGGFHDRARGLNVDMQRYAAVNNAVTELRLRLRENINKYVSDHYGRAKTFLESLVYEFELTFR